MTAKPAATLTVGDCINAAEAGTLTGALTIINVWHAQAAGDYTEIDVSPDRDADVMTVIADYVGAQSAQWLTNLPEPTYRLYYLPDTDVKVTP